MNKNWLRKFPIIYFGLFLSFGILGGQLQADFQPQGFPVVEKKEFSLQYDSRNKIPLWVQETLNISRLTANVSSSRNRPPFTKDTAIYPLHQSIPNDYAGSGFDRGHMACAANHRASRENLTKTFLLSNICPQNSQLNQGFWARFENHIRNLVLEEGYKTVRVTTGPLFLPQEDDDNGRRYVKYEVIGENNVAVPTHFFKVIKPKKSRRPSKACWAYIVPNEDIPSGEDFEKYRVSIDKIEKVSGLIFRKQHSS